MTDSAYDAFLASLIESTLPAAETLLWRVTKGDRDMVCRARQLRSGEYVALELRVEHNGQVYLTEVHRERVAFVRRVAELRELLIAEAWTSVTEVV